MGDTGREHVTPLAPQAAAWIAPRSDWGYSNTGIVYSGDAALLIDTLMDPRLTSSMLAELRRELPIGDIHFLVNTHSDGDHWFGNQVLPDAEKWATIDCIREMGGAAAGLDWMRYLLGCADELGQFGRSAFGHFAIDEIDLTPATAAFSESATLPVGDTEVQLLDFGAGHSPGDAVVVALEARVAFAGDLLFSQGTPVAWTGDPLRLIGCLDRLLRLDVDLYVPGHGPVCRRTEVEAVRSYYEFVAIAGADLVGRGVPFDDALDELDLGYFSSLADSSRIVANLASLYRTQGGEGWPTDREAVLRRMVRYEAEHRGQ